MTARTLCFAGVGVAMALGLGSGCGRTETRPTLRVAVASNMAPAMQELQKDFLAKTGVEIVTVLGASGMLAKQLSEGAPYDAFVSANAGFADEAIEARACNGKSKRVYAQGKLALWMPNNIAGRPSSVSSSSRAGLTRYFQNVSKLAIANPEHAPYGKAAREVLERLDLRQSVTGKLVYGEDVQQARQFAATGNADAAFLPLSLVLDQPSVVLVEPSLHAPLQQVVVACVHGKNAKDGERFVQFMTGANAGATLARFGYESANR